MRKLLQVEIMKFPFTSGKGDAERTAGKGYVPTDRVQQLMSRGFSQSDVIDVLRREGFSADEIDSAFTQAVKGGVKGESPAVSYSAEKPDFLAGQQQPTFPPTQQQQVMLPTIDQIKQRQQSVLPETSLPSEYYQSYPTEDYIDYIINERMTDVNQQMNEFAIRYTELEKRMEEIKSQLNTIIQTRGGEQQQVISKVDNVGDTLEDITARLGSLERAFKETLPALIESVRALCDLVQKMKRGA
jgi:hypothetical protein